MATKDISKISAEKISKKKKTGSSKPTKEKQTTRKKKKDQRGKEKPVDKKEIAVSKPGDNISEDVKGSTRRKVKQTKSFLTHDGHNLTRKEAMFIDLYIETGNIRQSVIQAGFETKAPGQYGNTLMNRVYIKNEIECRMKEEHSKRIASGEEVMQFFTKVMNGEVKDQFGLDAPLSERIKAGQEIAKRTVDIANRLAGVTQGQNEVTIKLDWDRKGI